MEDYITFFLKHWELSVALLAIVSLIISLEYKSKRGGVQRLSAQDVMLLLNHQNGVLIDIRDMTPYQQGHILHAIHIPQQQVLDQLPSLEKYKTQPVILVCANGQQSATLASKLYKQGFTQVATLQEGMTTWRQAKLPVVKGKK